MRVRALFPEHVGAARRLGHKVVETDFEAVVISCDPWLAVTPEAWEIIQAAVRRLPRPAKGRGRPPANHDPEVLRRAVAAYGSKTAAAKALGMNRKTLRKYLEGETCE
jgi:hypothetical protein